MIEHHMDLVMEISDRIYVLVFVNLLQMVCLKKFRIIRELLMHILEVPQMSNILEVKDLSVSYGGIKAVKNISFQVPKGEIVTLIGANGAGKSSTLRSIVGLVKPKTGSIKLNGNEIAGKTPEQIVSQGITLVPEGRRVFADLTVLENLKIGAYMRKDSLEEDINWCYDLFPRLKERNWQLAGTLSGGEQQMLAIARALMSRPDIIRMRTLAGTGTYCC